jgi:fatty-acid desaturase
MISLQYEIWHTGAVQIFTGLIALLSVILLFSGIFTLPQILVLILTWFVIHQTLTAFGCVGAHFKYCHRAFKTTTLVDRILAIGVCLICIGVPLQWNIGHTAHHDYPGTRQDPHNANSWRGIFLGRYIRPDKYSFRFAKDLIKDSFHVKLVKYGLLPPILLSGMLLLVGVIFFGTFWYVPVMFAYWAPLFTTLTAGALHNVLSHDQQGNAKDLPWLCWLFPFEWAHGEHHKNPQNINKNIHYPWIPDPAYWIIRKIRIA